MDRNLLPKHFVPPKDSHIGPREIVDVVELYYAMSRRMLDIDKPSLTHIQTEADWRAAIDGFIESVILMGNDPDMVAYGLSLKTVRAMFN